jgi:hypothetical protein
MVSGEFVWWQRVLLEALMMLGLAERQGDLFDEVNRFGERTLAENSIFVVLHRERGGLFPDELFADLFCDRGRRSVPPSVVATVMVLQKLHGLSDREAVEAYAFDARWRYAAGVGGYDGDGWGCFAHTVLVDMRARLAASARPRRIFEVTVDVAAATGLVGAKRVLDSTPVYDAVATMDTVTLIRSAIRGLLTSADSVLAAGLRAVLSSGDDYASTAKPQIDWDDPTGREQLIDSRARDGYRALGLLEGHVLGPAVTDAAQLLAAVLGQDLQDSDDGVFRIARRVAKDRVISTVDPAARHGHKTAARGFDGYKGHVAVEPDSEIITDTEVSAGNVGDAAGGLDLIDDLLTRACGEPDQAVRTEPVEASAQPAVDGDAAYGAGQFLDTLARHDIEANCKTQPPSNTGELFAKDLVDVDLDQDTATCPAGHDADIVRNREGDGIACFGEVCAGCPMRASCTNAAGGRTIAVGRYEHHLADARDRQQDPAWIADYRATRPKVERKLGHLMRRTHGARRARVRGRSKVDADFNLLAAATNLARLAVLGLHTTPAGWAIAPAST